MDPYKNVSKVKAQYPNNFKKTIYELQQKPQVLDWLPRIYRCSLGEEVKGISWRESNMFRKVFQKNINSLIRLYQRL